MWHVSNEYGCHVPACYCELSAAAFSDWLRERYGDLGAPERGLGRRGVEPGLHRLGPGAAAAYGAHLPNPAQQLDFARFSSGELLACYRAEREAILARDRHAPVTTNFMGFHRSLTSSAGRPTSTSSRWTATPTRRTRSPTCCPP